MYVCIHMCVYIYIYIYVYIYIYIYTYAYLCMHFVVQGAGLPFTSRMSGVPVRRALGHGAECAGEQRKS